MSQKTNKTNKSKMTDNTVSNMDDCQTNYTSGTNSLVDSANSSYNTAKKQTNKKKNGATDCR